MYKGLGFINSFTKEQEDTLAELYNNIDDPKLKELEERIKDEYKNMIEYRQNTLVQVIRDYNELVYTEFISAIDNIILERFNATVKNISICCSIKGKDRAEFESFVDGYDTLIKAIFKYSTINKILPNFWVNLYSLSPIEKMVYRMNTECIELYDETSRERIFDNDDSKLTIYSVLILKHDILKKMVNENKWNEDFTTLYYFAKKLNWNKNILEEERNKQGE